jgi:DNA/RNA-binding domain of Phe-tRNA-synthetase-like protein
VHRKNLSYEISSEVFDQFPGYIRGVVRAYGVENRESCDELIALLREAEDSVRARLKAENLTEHPGILSWREAYRAFGAKPAKFRPSMEAMARRVLKNQELPSISSLVDIGNIVSLKYLVPAGGHAIDVMEQDIALRAANGDEEFTAFGSDQVEHPLPGEIILTEGTTVLTRRWTWRQANHTLVLPTTTSVEVNVDGLPPVEPIEVEEACREIMRMIEQFCGGTISFEILSKEHPSMVL